MIIAGWILPGRWDAHTSRLQYQNPGSFIECEDKHGDSGGSPGDCDEPGSWEKSSGKLMWDSLRTACGKPDSDLKVILIGTIAPAVRGWWPDLIAGGCRPGRYVQVLQGREDRWRQTREIKRVNPLMWDFPESVKTILQERDDALVELSKRTSGLQELSAEPSDWSSCRNVV